MTPIKILGSLKLLSWGTILVGLRKHWITRQNVIDYALELVEESNDEEAIDIIINQIFLSDKEFIHHVSNKIKSMNECMELDKWRLAHLLYAIELKDDQAKLDKLQEIYANFNYPDDMSACSIYSSQTTAPLMAMIEVIEKLKQQLIINN